MRVDHIVVTETYQLNDAGSQQRRTGDGYLVSTPRVGRTGIQVYAGAELGRRDLERVRVWRPEAEVMDKAAMSSIAHRPVTNDHPTEAVDAKNWRKYSVGHTGDTIARDGDFVRVPMIIMDADTIKDIEAGKRELSLGYSSNIEWRSGVTDGGEQYDAVQTQIRVNHLAIVDAARGGPKLAIGDGVSLDDGAVTAAKALIADGDISLEAIVTLDGGTHYLARKGEGHDYPFVKDGQVYRAALVNAQVLAKDRGQSTVADAATQLLQLIDTKGQQPMAGDKTLKTLLVDGITCEMTDTAIEVVNRRIKALEDALFQAKNDPEAEGANVKKKKMAADAQIAELTTAAQTKDAEIATLKTQLADAKITPQKLDQMVKDRAVVIEKAKTILGDKLVVDGKTEIEIQKQVVSAKLGDVAKDWNDTMVTASFHTLTAGDPGVGNSQRMGDAFSGQRPAGYGAARDQTPYDKYDAKLNDAWKAPAGQA